MDKNEMKNRISMALKDPILQQGFEIICKNLAELEKEKADLIQEKYNLEYKIENLENKVEHHQEVIDTFKKENAELKADNDARMFAMAMSEKVEKQLREENAELKKKLLEIGQHLELTEREWGRDTTKLIYCKTQLSKAKEIIKDLIDTLEVIDGEQIRELKLVKQAEQFLNGEVEK